MTSDIKQMIADIEGEVFLTSSMTGKKKLADKVMASMAIVPRDKFVPPEIRAMAFANGPLMIGHGQTISQPFIVALMTDLLELTKKAKVLEIGTGSGYQTAVLSLLAKKVYSVELITALSKAAKERLQNLNYMNIETHIGNGYEGWEEHAPYDAIIVTAAAEFIPPALTEQLKPGGKMVMPVGLPNSYQELMLIEKDEQNMITTQIILGVAFVPLVQQAPMDS